MASRIRARHGAAWTVSTAPGPGREARPTSAGHRPAALAAERVARQPGPHAQGLAEDHERVSELYPGWRHWLITHLRLGQGQVVLDAGCGGGVNFPELRDRVGPTGRIIALEPSADLRAVAAHRIARRRWTNITLVSQPADLTGMPRADAALFCGAHDLLQDPQAVSGIIAALRPGARIVAGGGKWPPGWLGPMLRHYVTLIHRRQVRDFAGFDQPWQHLARHVDGLQVSSIGFGTGYLAHGQVPKRRLAPVPPADS